MLAAGAGTVFQLQSADAWTRFNSAYAGGSAPTRESLPSVDSLRGQATVQHGLAVGGFVAGGVLLAGGRRSPSSI